MDDHIHFDELSKIQKDITNLFEKKKFINPQIADDLILIAQQKVKRYLTNLFENGFSDLIKENEYNQFILYSYKSYYGEIPAQTTKNNQIYKRRQKPS